MTRKSHKSQTHNKGQAWAEKRTAQKIQQLHKRIDLLTDNVETLSDIAHVHNLQLMALHLKIEQLEARMDQLEQIIFEDLEDFEESERVDFEDSFDSKNSRKIILVPLVAHLQTF